MGAWGADGHVIVIGAVGEIIGGKEDGIHEGDGAGSAGMDHFLLPVGQLGGDVGIAVSQELKKGPGYVE